MSCLIFFSLYVFFDMTQIVLNAVMRGLSRFVLATCVMSLWLWAVYEPLALGLGVFYFSSLKLIYIIQGATVGGLALTYGIILCIEDWAKIAESVHKKMRIEEIENPLRPNHEA